MTKVTEEQMSRIEQGLEIPPKPDFISQDEWDMLLAARQPTTIRSFGSQQAEAYMAGVEGSDQMAGAPVIVVATVGRKSGKEIPTALNFIEDSGDYYICGSFFGLTEAPHWAKNLAAQPKGWIQVGSLRRSMVANKVTGVERQRIWALMVEQFPLWGYFQQYCRREFEIYRIHPESGS